jgi:UDP-glucose 4-epimerase
MKIAVFGYGFISKNIVLELSKKDYEIVVFSRNTNKESILPNVTFYKVDLSKDQIDFSMIYDFDTALHLVNVGIPGNNDITNNQKDIKTLENTLSFCSKARIKKFVFISSASVYGDSYDTPISEEDSLMGSSEYAKSRIKMEQKVRHYFNFDKSRYLILRPSNPFGPFQKKQGIIYKILNSIETKELIKIDNAGESTRDYVYIKDVVNMIETLINNQCSYDTYNLSSSKGISVNNLIDLIKNLGIEVNNTLKIDNTNMRKSISVLSNDRILQEFENLKFHSLEEALMKTYKWVKSKE